jgi:hypothetical protein
VLGSIAIQFCKQSVALHQRAIIRHRQQLLYVTSSTVWKSTLCDSAFGRVRIGGHRYLRVAVQSESEYCRKYPADVVAAARSRQRASAIIMQLSYCTSNYSATLPRGRSALSTHQLLTQSIHRGAGLCV